MYPISLDIADKPVLIIGAGNVGERKIMSVFNACADLTVISEEYGDRVARLAKEGKIHLVKRQYRQGDCAGYYMVIASTDSPGTNADISQECRERGILVNIVDRPELCSFHVPAVLQRGDFQIAISTGGKSPSLSREIRLELEGMYGEEYGRLTDRLGRIRENLKSRYGDDYAELIRQLTISFTREYARFKHPGEDINPHGGLMKKNR